MKSNLFLGNHDDPSHHIVVHEDCAILLVPCDYGESPDEWGDTSLFLGEVDTKDVRIGRKNYGYRDGEAVLPWGEGKWGEYGDKIPEDSGHTCSDPANDPYPTYRDCDACQALELYEEWLSHASDREGWEVIPVDLRYYGSGSYSLRKARHSGEWIETRYGHSLENTPDGFVFVAVGKTDIEKLARADEPSPDELADRLIETWQTYLEGDVWSMKVVKLPDGWQTSDERIDLDDEAVCQVLDDWCGGFYGYDYAVSEGKSIIEWHKKNPQQSMAS